MAKEKPVSIETDPWAKGRKILQEALHVVDPKKLIIEKLGDISDIQIFGRNILVATYVPPEKTKSGIIVTSTQRKESEYQGKVGLVIAVGPDAFENDPEYKTNLTAKIGDWVTYRHSDGVARSINGIHCRNISWVDLLEKVGSPDRIM